MTQWRLLSSIVRTKRKQNWGSERGDNEDISSLGHDAVHSTYPEYEGYTFVRNVCNDILDWKASQNILQLTRIAL
jgi:hypothetical protein